MKKQNGLANLVTRNYLDAINAVGWSLSLLAGLVIISLISGVFVAVNEDKLFNATKIEKQQDTSIDNWLYSEEIKFCRLHHMEFNRTFDFGGCEVIVCQNETTRKEFKFCGDKDDFGLGDIFLLWFFFG